MFNKFEIIGVEEQGVVHFLYLGGDVQDKYEVAIIDLNTNLIVHKSHMELKSDAGWWISTGPSNARRLKNAALRIKIGNDYYTENITFNGENRYLVVNSEPKTLHHNGDELFPIVCEIFYDKVYERDFVKVNQGDVVVDIGANYGVFSLYAQQFNPSKVFAMEPIKSTFKCMSDNLKEYGVTCVNKAIGDEDGFESFAITDVNGNNFSLRHSDGYHPSVMNDAEIVETTTFNTFVNDYDIDRIDFLKVDCEGGELDLFETIDTNFLKSSIKKIAMEYHSSKIKERVIEILTSNGFVIEDSVGMTEIGLIYAYNTNI
jgi:FkbM family methyltransferase